MVGGREAIRSRSGAGWCGVANNQPPVPHRQKDRVDFVDFRFLFFYLPPAVGVDYRQLVDI